MFQSLRCIPLHLANQSIQYLLFAQHRPIWRIVNTSAYEIIQQLQQQEKPNTVALWLQQRYNIPLYIAQSDVAAVIQEVQQAGLDDATFPPVKPLVKSLFLHLTDHCNLHCQHCYAMANQQPSTIPLPSILQILQAFQEIGGKKITLSGGEPLVHPDFEKIIEKCFLFSTTQLLTNGTLLTPQMVQKWMDKPIQLQISLDGSCSSIHDAIRGQGSFQQTMQGIRILQDAGFLSKVNLCTTVLPSNWDDLGSIIRLAESLGVYKLRFLHLQNLGRASQDWLEVQHHLTHYPQNVLQQLGHDPQINIECGISGLIFQLPPGEETWCPIGHTLVIAANQDVYPCPWLMQPEWKLGNLQQTPLQQIVSSTHLQQICEIVRDRPRKISECITCSWRNLCQSGCLAYAYNLYHTPWARDQFCEYRRQFYQASFTSLASG